LRSIANLLEGITIMASTGKGKHNPQPSLRTARFSGSGASQK
jgi:hypothetical protein